MIAPTTSHDVHADEALERFGQREFDADCAAARQAEGDGTGLANHLPRTDAQRIFDALAAIFLASASTPPGSQPPEPVVNIVVDSRILWSEDGHSDADNGTCTCGRHDRFRNAGCRIERDDDGQLHTYRPDGTEIA